MPVTDANSQFLLTVAPAGTPATANSPLYRVNSRGGIDVKYGDGIGNFVYGPNRNNTADLNNRYAAALAAAHAEQTTSPGLQTVIPRQWLADP